MGAEVEQLGTGSTDLDLFDAICSELLRTKRPTVGSICAMLGEPMNDPPRHRRGSLFLKPFDSRLHYAAIDPDAEDAYDDLPLEFVGLGGPSFSLRVSDVLKRFPQYRLKPNLYDGGYQIFHYPVADRFEFSAVSFNTREEEIPHVEKLTVDNVSFHFGDNLVEGRDRFMMKRRAS